MLSIVIVHYKTLNLTTQTIQSVYDSKLSMPFEIILVDNASLDESLTALKESFPEVLYLENNENLGFAKANNRAFKIARGDYILMLNSDVFLYEDTLENVLNYLKAHTEIGAIGAKLLLPSGGIDHNCKRGFPTPLSSLYYFTKRHEKYPNSKRYGHYTQSFVGEDEIAEVDALVGAFMMIPRKIIEALDGLDENYFMYGEDLDLCYRINQMGYKIVYYPKAIAVHFKGGSGRNIKVNNAFYGAMWHFYKTHYINSYSWATTVLVAIGIFIIWLMKSLTIGFRRLRHDQK